MSKGIRADLPLEIVRLYREGLSAPTIAKRFGVHRVTVQRYLKRLGIKRLPGFRSVDFTPPPQKLICAYIAGLFDGEGSVCIRRNGSIQVSIYNTHRETMRWLHSLLGGYLYGYLSTKKARKLIWKWTRSGAANCRAFLQMVLPYLRIKRTRAIKAVSWVNDKLAGENPKLPWKLQPSRRKHVAS